MPEDMTPEKQSIQRNMRCLNAKSIGVDSKLKTLLEEGKVGFESDLADITCGVPQGSILRPHQGPGDSRSYLFLFRSFRIVELHRGSSVLFYIRCYQTHFSLMLRFSDGSFGCFQTSYSSIGCFSQVVLGRTGGDRIYEIR